jgi:hypothetical protein
MGALCRRGGRTNKKRRLGRRRGKSAPLEGADIGFMGSGCLLGLRLANLQLSRLQALARIVLARTPVVHWYFPLSTNKLAQEMQKALHRWNRVQHAFRDSRTWDAHCG